MIQMILAGIMCLGSILSIYTDRLYAAETLKVGLFQNKPIVYFEDGPKGLFVDILGRVAIEEGWHLEYVLCELQDCLRLVKANQIDLMTSLGISQERLSYLSFSRESVWTFWGTIYSHDNRVTGIFDLEGMTIGIRRQNKITLALEKMLSEFNISVHYIGFDNYEQAFKAFTDKQLDAVAVNNTYGFGNQAEFHQYRTPIVFSPFSAYFAVPKNSSHTDKLAIIDGYVKDLKQGNSSFYRDFNHKWFGVTREYWTSARLALFGSVLALLITTFLIWRYYSLRSLNKVLVKNISERELAEKRMLESNNRLMTILDRAPVDIYIADMETHNVLYMNKQMIASFGQDYTGEKCWKVFRGEERPCKNCRMPALLDENNRPANLINWEDAEKINGKHYLNHDFAINWIDNRIAHIQLAVDITKRKIVEETLRENEERFRNIIQHAKAGYFLIDNEGLVQEVNAAWLKMHKYDSPGEIIGQTYLKTHTEDNLQKAEAVVKSVLAGKSIPSGESSRQNKDGSTGHHIFSTVPVVTQGSITGLEGFVIDTTERRAVEKQIQDSLKEKEILLKEIHHRVKNNMQVISSLLDLQSNSIENDRVRSILKESQSRVYVMSVVHETLYESKDLSNIDLKAYVRKISTAIVQTYNVTLDQVQLDIDVDDISIDISQASSLGLIINELLSNALKYAFPNNDKGKLTISAKMSGLNLVLIISDNGIGMPDGLDWRKTESLGFKLVRTLVEKQLDGSIELENKGGAQFTIAIENFFA